MPGRPAQEARRDTGGRAPAGLDAARSLARRALGGGRWHLDRLARRLRYLGWRVECPCCERHFRAFAPHPWGPDPQTPGICPGCGSYERQRALILYLRRRTTVLGDPPRPPDATTPAPAGHSAPASHPVEAGHPAAAGPAVLLDCAPSASLMGRLSRALGPGYVSVDLDSPLAAVKADLMDLPFGPGSFDVVLCSHVLEHVADDRRAMGELCRVLRPGGFAAVLVPVHGGLTETLEDPALTTPQERLAAYGQADHVRLYGRDFPARLGEGGFAAVERVSMFESLPAEEVDRFGLSLHDDIYVCRVAPVP